MSKEKLDQLGAMLIEMSKLKEQVVKKKKKQTHDSRRPELQKSKDKEKILQVPGGGKTPFKPQG